MGTLLFLVVIASTIWVYIDAQKKGIRKGVGVGFFDMGPIEWSICTLLLWVLAFPLYLLKRDELARIAAGGERPIQGREEKQSGINVAAKMITFIWTGAVAVFSCVWLYNIMAAAPAIGSEYEQAGFGIGIAMGAGMLFLAWAIVVAPAAVIYMMTKRSTMHAYAEPAAAAKQPTTEAKTKRCLYCDEIIPINATYCLHCSHGLTGKDKDRHERP